MSDVRKNTLLLIVGGITYFSIEVLFRGYSHWTMALIGGHLFLFIGGLNEYFPWDMSLVLQGVIGAIAITITEFIAGCVLNLWLKLDLWDYSNLPFNVLGQICPSFSLAWFALSVVAIFLDDWLRWKLFGEEKPHYRI